MIVWRSPAWSFNDLGKPRKNWLQMRAQCWKWLGTDHGGGRMNSSAGEAELQIVPGISTIREAQEFLADAADFGAISQSGCGQKRLFEIGDGAADGILQSAGSVLGAGAKDESRADPRGGGLQHGESRGGGSLGGEAV